MGSAKEEGSDVPGALMPGQRVDTTEAWRVWDLEQADREGISKVTNRASHGITNTIQAGGKEKKRTTALKEEVDLPTACQCSTRVGALVSSERVTVP